MFKELPIVKIHCTLCDGRGTRLPILVIGVGLGELKEEHCSQCDGRGWFEMPPSGQGPLDYEEEVKEGYMKLWIRKPQTI